MSEFHDRESNMHEPRTDDWVIENLLRGTLPTDAVPPVYGGLAHAFAELRSLLPGLELATEVTAAATVPAIALAVRSASPGRARSTSKARTVGRVIAMKAAIVGAVLIGATAAAAATGSLPAPAQRFVSHILRDVGISVPSASESGTGTSAPPTTMPAHHPKPACAALVRTAAPTGVEAWQVNSVLDLHPACVPAGGRGVRSGKSAHAGGSGSKPPRSKRAAGAGPPGAKGLEHRSGHNGNSHAKGTGEARPGKGAKAHPKTSGKGHPKGGKGNAKKVGKAHHKAGGKGG